MPDTNPPNPQDLGNIVSGLAGSVTLLSSTIDKLGATLEESIGPTAQMRTNFDRMTLSIRGMVDYVGEWKETLTEALAINKKLATGGIYDTKTLKGAKERLLEFNDALKKLSQRTGQTREQQFAFTKMLEGTGKALAEVERRAKRAGKGLDEALDAKAIVAIQHELRTTISLVDKYTSSLKKVNYGPMTAGIKSVNELLGRSGRLEKVIAHAEKLKAVGTAASDKMAAGHKAHQEWTEAKKYKIGRKNLSAAELPTTQAGYAALGKRDRTRIGKIATAAQGGLDAEVEELAGTGKTPKGMLNRFMTRKILENRNRAAMGEIEMPTGWMGEKGLKALSAGGGDFSAGAGMMKLGGIADVAGEAMGAAALPIAAVAGVGVLAQKLFDATVERNKDVYGKLGGAGIFGGPNSGEMAFENVKSNLTPGFGKGLFYNALGSTYENNLKMAAAVAGSGVSMSELSRGGNGLGSNFIGKVGQTALVGGRLAGMDETQATEQIMKLLQRYHQSLESTDQFFFQLNKDTKAAGITTSKYIQIIDSITDSFDHMARSIDDVTGVMRVMGATGTQTSEMVADALKALTAGDKTTEQKAFIGTEMMNHPEVMTHMLNARNKEVEEGGQNITNTLKGVGFTDQEISSMGNLGTPAGLQEARAQLNQRMLEQGPNARSAPMAQAAGAAIAEQQMRINRQQNISGFVGNRTPEGAINYAFGSGNTPMDFLDKSSQNIAAMESVLDRAGVKGGFGELFSGNVMGGPKAGLINQIAGAEGLDPQIFNKLIESMGVGGAQLAQSANQGAAEITPEQYKKYAAMMGKSGLSNDAAKDFIKKLNPEGVKNLGKALSKDTDTLWQMIDGTSALRKVVEEQETADKKAEQVKKATEVAVSTRPIADIFASAFTNLFNTISRPLVRMVDFLEGVFGTGKASGQAIENLQGRIANGSFGSANVDADLSKLSATREGFRGVASQMQDFIDTENQKTNLTDEDKKKIDTATQMRDEAIAKGAQLDTQIEKITSIKAQVASGDVTKKEVDSINSALGDLATTASSTDPTKGALGQMMTDEQKHAAALLGNNPAAGDNGAKVTGAGGGAGSGTTVNQDNRQYQNHTVGTNIVTPPSNANDARKPGEQSTGSGQPIPVKTPNPSEYSKSVGKWSSYNDLKPIRII